MASMKRGINFSIQAFVSLSWEEQKAEEEGRRHGRKKKERKTTLGQKEGVRTEQAGGCAYLSTPSCGGGGNTWCL